MKYIVPFESVPTYSPAGHRHTTNRRLIGKDHVDARSVEVVHGELLPGGVAERHAHDDIDQVVHVVTGQARVEIGDERAEVGPRTTLWIPATVPHEITAIGAEPLHLLVVYTPPLYR
ncbi:MAG TPA: cupin domain-containing protein [Chloroflexota bacterium]|jgi:mannose-6-phosphate isomerase-like protein (cupin superfamily)